MKTLTNILFVCFLLCTNSVPGTEHPALITQHSALILADSLMHVRPDTALQLLQAILPDTLPSAEQRAHYALLLTQAHDKNYLTHTSDSLILTAVRHYNHTGNTPKQALSHYYLGSVYRDMNKLPAALEAYHKAMDYAKACADERLMGRVYNGMAYIYQQQSMLLKADSLYADAETIAAKVNDSLTLANVLIRRAMYQISLGKEHYSDASTKLLRAYSMAKQLHNLQVQGSAAITLSMLYTRMKQPEKAMHYARQNYHLPQIDSTSMARAALLLGEAHYKLCSYDSAVHYLKQCLLVTDNNILRSACMRLSDVAKAQNDFETALMWEERRARYEIAYAKSGEIVQIVSDKRETSSGLWLFFFILVVGLISLFCYFRFFYKKTPLPQDVTDSINLDVDITSFLAAHNEKAYIHKMERILDYHKSYADYEEHLSVEDFNALTYDVNQYFDGFIELLKKQYPSLTKSDIHFYILFLMGYSDIEVGILTERDRSSVYRRRKRINVKMQHLCNMHAT